MTTGTLTLEEVESENKRIEGIRDISSMSVLELSSPLGSTEASCIAFVPPLYPKEVPPWLAAVSLVELKDQRFRHLKESEKFLHELSEPKEEQKKIRWSEDIVDKIDTITLVSEYIKGNIVPSEQAEIRAKKLFDKVAEEPPFQTVEETVKWLRGRKD